jgi:hypothetical protein
MNKKRKNPLLSSGLLLLASIVLVLLSVYVLKPQFQKDKEKQDSSTLLWKDAKRDQITELFISNGHWGLECEVNYCDKFILSTRLEEGVFDICKRDIHFDTFCRKVLDSVHMQGEVTDCFTPFDIWLNNHVF